MPYELQQTTYEKKKTIHKNKEVNLLEKTFIQIETLQKEEQIKENSPLKVSLEALPSFNLINFLSRNALDLIIQACACMPTEQREQVGGFCSNALGSLQSKKVTLLSVGSYRLQQELMTAKTLMKKGFDVNLILVEPCYYLDALGFDRVDYPKLKQSFDAVVSEMSRTYGTSCKIIAVFPAIHFYLKMLTQSLNYSIDDKFLLKNIQQFMSFTKQNFYYYQTTKSPIDNTAYYKDFLKISPNAVLIIQQSNTFYWALRYDALDPKSFFLESTTTNISKILETVGNRYPQTVAPMPVELKKHLTKNECEYTENMVRVRAASQFFKAFDQLYKGQYKENYLAAVDLIPDIIMAIDSDNQHMSSLLSGLIIFFKESCYKNGTYFNPTIINFERLDHKPRRISQKVTLEENFCQVSRVPKEVLGQFSYVRSKGMRLSFFPENVIQCIADYANTENVRP